MNPRISRRSAAAWLLLLALSLALHLVQLGERSFHHDESIHAKLSWDLAERGVYRYDPTYHGPLLYYLTAGFYLVAGDSDFTARLSTAFAGIGLLGVAWCLRRPFGERAAWWTGLLATISPLILFYGRFLRMDVLELLTASAAVVAFWRAARGSALAWVAVGAWAGLAFATKENAYVTCALLGLTALLLAVDAGIPKAVRITRHWLVAQWSGIAMAVGAFVVVTVPLYTAGFAHPEDWLFPLDAIRYWWGQHSIQRVAGPWWFYLPRLAQYEFLPIAAATAWVVRRWRRLRPIELGIYAFGVLSVLMYMYLGEKVPWLGVHQVWAFLPLAGAQLARTFGPRGRWWSRSLAVAGLAATAAASVSANFVLDEITPAQPRVESLHFVQTTPELTAVAREVLELERPDGLHFVAAVDGEAAWPLNWHLRSAPIWWGQPRRGDRPLLVICDIEDEAGVRATLGTGYVRERIPLRAWWLMYEGDPSLGDWLRYMLTRRPWGVIGSSDVVVLRRGDGGTAQSRTEPPPAALGRILEARTATVFGEGWFGEIRGLDVGVAGVAAADAALSEVVLVDPEGAVREPAPGEVFNQPEDVAWLGSAAVLVADTWNHRVVRIEVGTGATTVLPPPEGGWFGPRSVAVAGSGAVVVSDTGNKRLVLYPPDLGPPSVLTSGEGWEGLVEPGGVAWTAAGTVVVCDTGNRRLLEVGVDGRLRREVRLDEGWTDFYSRPQVAVLGDGRWIASDTPRGSLWLVDGEGAVRLLDLRGSGVTPTGVAAAGGALWLGDLAGAVRRIGVDDG